jgi:hypothetical protein
MAFVGNAIPAYDELNPVTRGGTMKMVRRGQWKLTSDTVGNSQLFDVAHDPYELNDLYGKAEAGPVEQQLMADLLQWTIRTQDGLPVAAYQPKWAQHNWYAPYATKGPA